MGLIPIPFTEHSENHNLKLLLSSNAINHQFHEIRLLGDETYLIVYFYTSTRSASFGVSKVYVGYQPTPNLDCSPQGRLLSQDRKSRLNKYTSSTTANGMELCSLWHHPHEWYSTVGSALSHGTWAPLAIFCRQFPSRVQTPLHLGTNVHY